MNSVSAKLAIVTITVLTGFSAFAQKPNGGGQIGSATTDWSDDLRANKSFIKTCPDKYLKYYDKAEGGPGFYCECPDENINYFDRHEGGPGYICLEK